MIQECDSTQHFLEAGVKGLGGHDYRFFLATMHVMKKAEASGNRASSGGNMIKKGVADFWESVRLVHSIVILCLGFLPLHKTNKSGSWYFAKLG